MNIQKHLHNQTGPEQRAKQAPDYKIGLTIHSTIKTILLETNRLGKTYPLREQKRH